MTVRVPGTAGPQGPGSEGPSPGPTPPPKQHACPWPDSAAARTALAVIQRLRGEGHEAYVAGGAVRDLLLGRDPMDFDVATSARPDAVMALFPKTVAVGVQFGVVRVLMHGREVEVATFRSDGAYVDGRHPSAVSYGSAAEDVLRRDFTINGLLYDPETETVIDYVGGMDDIQAGLVRCIGAPADRFREDHLRMLRAVRFAVRLDFGIAPETESALRRHASAIRGVSAERIRDELLKMLLGPRPDRAIRLLEALGLLAVVLPEVAALRGVAQPPDFHPEGDVFEHTLRAVAHLVPPPAAPEWARQALALATLLHDVGKATRQTVRDGRIHFYGHEAAGAAQAAAIAERLRLSRKQRERVAALVADHGRLREARQMRRARLLRLLREPHAEDLLALHRADRLAGSGDLDAYHFARAVLAQATEEQLRPTPLLRGHDLLARGVTPGPRIGQILRALEDAQLEGAVSTRAEAEAWLEAQLTGREDPDVNNGP